MFSNADMQSKDIQNFCHLDSSGEELLKMAITKLGLSARAYDRILKVARTIADLSSSSSIRSEYISEAPPAAGRDSVSQPGSEPVEWVNGDVLY